MIIGPILILFLSVFNKNACYNLYISIISLSLSVYFFIKFINIKKKEK